jgi:hypothetical protein
VAHALADRSTSMPPPEPRSSTTSPACSSASAVGFPQPREARIAACGHARELAFPVEVRGDGIPGLRLPLRAAAAGARPPTDCPGGAAVMSPHLGPRGRVTPRHRHLRGDTAAAAGQAVTHLGTGRSGSGIASRPTRTKPKRGNQRSAVVVRSQRSSAPAPRRRPGGRAPAPPPRPCRAAMRRTATERRRAWGHTARSRPLPRSGRRSRRRRRPCGNAGLRSSSPSSDARSSVPDRLRASSARPDGWSSRRRRHSTTASRQPLAHGPLSFLAFGRKASSTPPTSEDSAATAWDRCGSAPTAAPLDRTRAGLAQEAQVVRHGGLLDRHRGLEIADAHLSAAAAEDPQERQPDGVGEQLQAPGGRSPHGRRKRGAPPGRDSSGSRRCAGVRTLSCSLTTVNVLQAGGVRQPGRVRSGSFSVLTGSGGPPPSLDRAPIKVKTGLFDHVREGHRRLRVIWQPLVERSM